MTDEEFDEFLSSAVEELQAKQDELIETQGLGTHARFWLDQTQGTLDFFDSAGVTRTRAAIVPVGSWSPKSNTWKWAWANDSMLPGLRERSRSLQQLAEATGRGIFETDLFDADEQIAWELTAIAVRHLGAVGAYRAPGRNSNLFLAITAFRHVGSEGWVT